MLNTATPGNFYNLTEGQQDYFRNLASGDPNRTPLQFFQDTVPVELQDKPELLEVFLNGGTVTTPEFTFTRGRNGGEFELVEHELPDRDWSHDVSRANGGSDSADNGRFEEASVNRSRGAADSTVSEQAAADAAAEEDVQTLLESVGEVGEAATWGAAADVAGGLFETALEGLLPVTGGAVAAKKVYDHFDEPADKVGFAALAGGATVAFLASPVGAPVVGAYVLWSLGKRGLGLWNKHVAA